MPNCIACKAPLERSEGPNDEWVWAGPDGSYWGRRFPLSVPERLAQAQAEGDWGLYSNLECAWQIGHAWDAHQHCPDKIPPEASTPPHSSGRVPWHCDEPMHLRPSGWHCRKKCGHKETPAEAGVLVGVG